MPWLFLAVAIVAELFGTLSLRAIANSPSWPVVAVVAVAYTLSFVAMTVSLRQLNVGVVYAVWSAVGIAGVSIVGAVLFGDKLGPQAIAGMGIIVLGVMVLVTSGSVRRG